MNIVTHQELENRQGISSVFFALTLDFLCCSPATISLLSPYSYTIHGPVWKPSCSQFNISESPSVIITAVESSGWRGCLIFQSLMSSIPVNITLLLKFMVIFSINLIYKLIPSNFLEYYMTSDLCRSPQMSVSKTFIMQHLVFFTSWSWPSHNL